MNQEAARKLRARIALINESETVRLGLSALKYSEAVSIVSAFAYGKRRLMSWSQVNGGILVGRQAGELPRIRHDYRDMKVGEERCFYLPDPYRDQVRVNVCRYAKRTNTVMGCNLIPGGIKVIRFPDEVAAVRRKSKYGLEKLLEPGDSLTLDLTLREVQNARAAVTFYGQRHEMRFTVHSDNGRVTITRKE